MYRFVGKPPNEMPHFFNEAGSVFTLATNANKRPYNDNLCFFRCIICVRAQANQLNNFRPEYIKLSDVNMLYDELHAT